MKIKLLKNRSDIGAGTRGSDMGIDAVEIAAINAGNDYFHRHLYMDIKSHNETIYRKNTNEFAKRIEHVLEQCIRVSDAVQQTFNYGLFPLIISGDHSSALGTISGIKAAHPEKTLGVIWLDAHADIHSPYTSPSGNIHGMPLAAALNMDNLECQINHPSDITLSHWNALKNIGVDGPKILPKHLLYFGLRDYEKAEEELIHREHIKYFQVKELRFNSLRDSIEDAIESLKECDHIYISFDVDSMDCDKISYGTGTPVKIGFHPQEIMNIIDMFINTGKVSCIEFCEINPLLDNKGNKMAETAFSVLDHISRKIESILS